MLTTMLKSKNKKLLYPVKFKSTKIYKVRESELDDHLMMYLDKEQTRKLGFRNREPENPVVAIYKDHLRVYANPMWDAEEDNIGVDYIVTERRFDTVNRVINFELDQMCIDVPSHLLKQYNIELNDKVKHKYVEPDYGERYIEMRKK